MDVDELSYVVGEEEAFWLLKLVLPYLNEFLIKLRALFSGDPATTMKVIIKFPSLNHLFFIFFFFTKLMHCAAGSTTVCFRQVWKLYNHLEND